MDLTKMSNVELKFKAEELVKEIERREKEKKKPIKGRRFTAYCCNLSKGKKWKVESNKDFIKHITWCDTEEEARSLIENLEGKKTI